MQPSATAEEAKRLAEVIGDFAELVHQKEAKFIFQNCGGKSITKKLIPKIKKVESSAPTITFVNEDSYHLSFYGYQCNRCFFTRELQEYRIYLDLQNMYEDLRKAVCDDQMSFSFDELLNWAQPLVMVVDHRNKTHEQWKFSNIGVSWRLVKSVQILHVPTYDDCVLIRLRDFTIWWSVACCTRRSLFRRSKKNTENSQNVVTWRIRL